MSAPGKCPPPESGGSGFTAHGHCGTCGVATDSLPCWSCQLEKRITEQEETMNQAKRFEDLLRSHIYDIHSPDGIHLCECGFVLDDAEPDMVPHLAAEINKAIGTLSREWGARMSGDTEITVVTEGTARYCANQHPQTWTVLSRYVTDWAEVTP